ncbi:sulfate adenylyltransferase subunit 1 [Nitrosomonas oligotropha]|uniref:Sulfate adenylyltransferase subunit 1 n=1 Tax=Nitrosomonas oligotropha TaxID=42354 RepID=A0A1H8JJZ5_9PROT|nr:sulfate adenylyltransferase subunit 1 [Nitrosomonas oligotropha]SEN81093.1 sulfate adenylyltransferase subunit 1 [Nitrosomonas oligotropha]
MTHSLFLKINYLPSPIQHVNTAPRVSLSLLTDGLQAEREQGITIDVAYRTPKRKFIIADTPGHEQYTRNTVTGASIASLVITNNC